MRFIGLRIKILCFLLICLCGPIFSQSFQGTPFAKLTYNQIQKLSLNEIKRMAEKGDSDAQLHLGFMCCGGTKTIKSNVPEGIRWYKKAIQNGNGRAALYLAEIYQHGPDGKPNTKEAMKWFWKASDLGDETATTWLAKWHKDGTNGVTQDYSTAIKLLQKLADRGNRNGIITLAEMHAKGEGVEKNPIKARELLKDISGDGRNDVSRILVEMAGYQIKNAKEGNIDKDKPLFPAFYIWRRAYQKKGLSHYKLFLVREDGTSTVEKKFSVTHEEAMEERRAKKPKITTFASYDDMIKFSTPTLTPTPMISPSKKWRINIPSGSWENDHSIHLREGGSNQMKKVDIPGGGWSWSALFWNPVMDLFYFSENQGSSTDRHNDYWQLDPEKKKFTFIGGGIGSFVVSPDGKWIIWNDGTWIQWDDHQIHAYNIESNKDYTLTKGHSDNFFYKWANDPSIGHWDKINIHIQAGKRHFFDMNYKHAIAEYQKAIDMDPENGTAFGFMGYSLLRNGQADEAIKCFNKAIQINQDDLLSYCNLALAYWSKSDSRGTTFWLERLYIHNYSYRKKVEQDPQFKDVIQTQEYKKMIRGRWGKTKSRPTINKGTNGSRITPSAHKPPGQ